MLVNTQALVGTVGLLGALTFGCGDDGESSTHPDATGGSGGGQSEGSVCAALGNQYVACGFMPPGTPIDAEYVTGCQTAIPELQWRPDYVSAASSCIGSLDCDSMEDYDDICYPQAIVEANDGMLDDATLSACDDSQVCADLATSGQIVGEGPVVECLNRWGECRMAGSTGGASWTEDHCLTVIALSDTNRAAAGDCLSLPCNEVVDCLLAAGAFNY